MIATETKIYCEVCGEAHSEKETGLLFGLNTCQDCINEVEPMNQARLDKLLEEIKEITIHKDSVTFGESLTGKHNSPASNIVLSILDDIIPRLTTKDLKEKYSWLID